MSRFLSSESRCFPRGARGCRRSLRGLPLGWSGRTGAPSLPLRVRRFVCVGCRVLFCAVLCLLASPAVAVTLGPGFSFGFVSLVSHGMLSLLFLHFSFSSHVQDLADPFRSAPIARLWAAHDRPSSSPSARSPGRPELPGRKHGPARDPCHFPSAEPRAPSLPRGRGAPRPRGRRVPTPRPGTWAQLGQRPPAAGGRDREAETGMAHFDF